MDVIAALPNLLVITDATIALAPRWNVHQHDPAKLIDVDQLQLWRLQFARLWEQYQAGTANQAGIENARHIIDVEQVALLATLERLEAEFVEDPTASADWWKTGPEAE